MSGVSRKGDKNQTGGAIIQTAKTVFVNGLPVGIKGSTISDHAPYGPPHPPHAHSTVTVGSPTVFAESIPIARIGSQNSCGHTMTEGSANVFVP